MSYIMNEYYRYYLSLFSAEKEPEAFFTYKSFEVKGFRGLKAASINFSKNDLVLLLGLNESGKTSILKAIECFDFNNDPEDKSLKKFFTSIRNKKDIECSTPSIITAKIDLSESLPQNFFKKVLKASGLTSSWKVEVKNFIDEINKKKSFRISRLIPFENGNPQQSYYQFDGVNRFSDQGLESVLAQEIVRRCPYILYFEDFQDQIPEKIFAYKQSVAFNSIWYEIIDGLFYNTNSNYSIKQYLTYFKTSNRREDDARTVLKQVNSVLQETFTLKWESLSGVKAIKEAELAFQEKTKYFEIKITENDDTTYSVSERSKGAIWYLAFLMKTEFRRKKLREGSGKPIYLIDEPASNLHSTAQKKMVEDFFKLVEDTTVIYTTHSQYLVSPSNVKNTYVVERSDGDVSCTKWGEYIKGKDSNISYYQPLSDCLDIVPNSFDIPWHKAIITEGPSDSIVLQLMQIILEIESSYVLYPGSSATNLSTLISLNLGWSASFKVLLDSDIEGKKQKQRYMEDFSLPDEQFILLPNSNKEIEKMFTKKELIELYHFAMGTKIDVVNKKQFLDLMRTLLATANAKRTDISTIISTPTKQRFSKLLKELEL